MARIFTLKQNSDFRRLYARGKSFANPALVSYIFKNNAGSCRIGITTSKKIGNAVERNRAKRVIRAAYSQVQSELVGGWDIVFVARSKTHKVKSYVVLSAMKKHLKAVGALK